MPDHHPSAPGCAPDSRRRYRSGIRPLEDRVSMSASPWSQLDRDEAADLLAGTSYVPNELIVALKNTAATFADVLAIESARDSVTAAAVTDQRQLSAATDQSSALYRLTVNAGTDFAGVLAAISNWTSVEWIVADRIAAAGGPEAADAEG